jgi:hypothetical protein
MDTTGKIRKVISRLKDKQKQTIQPDVPRSTIPKLNSPVLLVSTNKISLHIFVHKKSKLNNL